jgi:hypothetical protein
MFVVSTDIRCPDLALVALAMPPARPVHSLQRRETVVCIDEFVAANICFGTLQLYSAGGIPT